MNPPARSVLFLLASGREGGNSETLARIAADGLPEPARWLRLADLPLPPFEDRRHDVGTYPMPEGHGRTILDALLLATDIVMVAPVYWYSLPAPAKLLLDHFSGWMRVPGLDFRARMAGKRLWWIGATSGDHDEAEPLRRSLELTAEYLRMRFAGWVLGNGSRPGDVLKDAVAVEAARAMLSAGGA